MSTLTLFSYGLCGGVCLGVVVSAIFFSGAIFYRFVMIKRFAERHAMSYEQAEILIDSYVWEN